MFEVIWNGRDALTDSLDRDYADMRGDGWDLIWVPTSPLTTDFRDLAPWAEPDFERHVKTSLARRAKRGPKGISGRVARDWLREYTGDIAQQGSRR